MVVVQPAFLEDPETQYWQECRRRAEILNVPAWSLAENEWAHQKVDNNDDSR